MSAVVDTWIPFIYRVFYDVPRLIVTSWHGRRFVLDCDFDDALDDYPSHYEVFVGEARDLDQDGWDSLVDRSQLRRVGTLDVSALVINRKAKLLDSTCLSAWRDDGEQGAR